MLQNTVVREKFWELKGSDPRLRVRSSGRLAHICSVFLYSVHPFDWWRVRACAEATGRSAARSAGAGRSSWTRTPAAATAAPTVPPPAPPRAAAGESLAEAASRTDWRREVQCVGGRTERNHHGGTRPAPAEQIGRAKRALTTEEGISSEG